MDGRGPPPLGGGGYAPGGGMYSEAKSTSLLQNVNSNLHSRGICPIGVPGYMAMSIDDKYARSHPVIDLTYRLVVACRDREYAA